MLRIHDVVCSQSGAVAETLPAARLRRHQNVKQSDRSFPNCEVTHAVCNDRFRCRALPRFLDVRSRRRVGRLLLILDQQSCE